MDKLIIKDRDQLKAIEDFMGYAPGYLSEIITWNDLMQVITKIESLTNNFRENGIRFQVSIDSRYLNAEERPFAHCVTITQNQHPRIRVADEIKINSVWKACIEFIQWYTQQQLTTNVHL